MLSAEARSFALRVLAVLAFLYFLNAFVQTGYVSPMQAIVGVAWLALCYWLSRVLGVMAVLGLSFAVMVLWGLFVESAPISDFRAFYDHAAEVSSGDLLSLFRTKSPPTVLYYAGFHWLLGTTYLVNYVASAVAWTGGAAFVYWALRPFVCDARDARFVCFALALWPTFILFSPVVSSEAVYFLLSAICAWLIARHIAGGRHSYLYVAMGIVAAALFLTRATGGLALIICLAVLTMGPRGPARFRQRVAAPIFVVVSFVAVWLSFAFMSPLVLPNALWPTVTLFNGPEVRLTASPWGSLSFLFGTNVEARGTFNAQDVELAGYAGERTRLARTEADVRARGIAVQRIAADPFRFARFALSAKVVELWGMERFDELEVGRGQWAYRGLDGVYRLTLLLFTVMLVREIHRPSYRLALGLIALALALPHVFLEVQSRYHLAITPLIVVGSALLVLDLQRRGAGWLSGRLGARRCRSPSVRVP